MNLRPSPWKGDALPLSYASPTETCQMHGLQRLLTARIPYASCLSRCWRYWTVPVDLVIHTRTGSSPGRKQMPNPKITALAPLIAKSRITRTTGWPSDLSEIAWTVWFAATWVGHRADFSGDFPKEDHQPISEETGSTCFPTVFLSEPPLAVRHSSAFGRRSNPCGLDPGLHR